MHNHKMPTQTADDIRDSLSQVLDTHADDLIRDTVRIIGFETVSGGTAEQEAKYQTEIPACLRWLKQRAEAMGFTYREWEGQVAEIEWAIPASRDGEKRPSMGIAAHIDVVTPVGTWKHGPYKGEIENGILYGRGIQDDKGPLIQALYGMYAAKEAGVTPPCDVRLIIGTSEETGDWSDIALYLRERGAPDYSFTPDADFPIITGEKGIMNVRVRAQWEHLGPHPETQMEFVSLKGGERTNIVPALAEAILRFPVEAKHMVMKEMVRETTRFTVENVDSNITLVPNNEAESEAVGYYESLISFIGKSAHSSTPAKGHNAIVDALRFFSDIETLPPPVRAFVQFLAFIGSTSDGTNLQINSTHPFVGDTTAVMSLLEINQKGGWANMNIRPTMGFPCVGVMDKVKEAARSFSDLSGLQIEVVETERLLDAIFLDPSMPGVDGFLRSLQTAYEMVTGEKGEMRAIGGTTYAKALPNCCAFGPVKMGVDEELAHQADEHLAVASIHRNALIYGLSIALMGFA